MSVVTNLMKKLLFNEQFADLYFVFDDGTRLPAHKNIVFTAAPYFESYGEFESKIKKRKLDNSSIESTDDSSYDSSTQIISIKEYSVKQIRIILRYIYTPTEDIGPIKYDPDYNVLFFGSDTFQLLELSKMAIIDGLTDHIMKQVLKKTDGIWLDLPVTDEELGTKIFKNGILRKSIKKKYGELPHFFRNLEEADFWELEEEGSKILSWKKDNRIYSLITFYKIALMYEQKRVGPIPEEFSEKNLKERVEYKFKKNIMKTDAWKDGIKNGEIEPEIINELLQAAL
jgi:hypothetical protein